MIQEIYGGGAVSPSKPINWKLIIGLFLLGIVIAIVIIYFSIKNTLDNGGTVLQAFAGKKLGSLCDGNKMCASNKCNRFNVCSL